MYFVAHCDNPAPEEFAVYNVTDEQALNFLFGKEETIRYIKENNIKALYGCLMLDEAHDIMENLKVISI